MNIDDLLRIATERRASDLHLKVGNYPHLRVDGELQPLTDQPRVSAEDMLTMAFSMMSARQKQKFKETTEIDMAYGVAGLGRCQIHETQLLRTQPGGPGGPLQTTHTHRGSGTLQMGEHPATPRSQGRWVLQPAVSAQISQFLS